MDGPGLHLSTELIFTIVCMALCFIGGGMVTILVAVKTKTFFSRYVLGAFILWGLGQNLFIARFQRPPVLEVASVENLKLQLIGNSLASIIFFGLTLYLYWKYVVPAKEGVVDTAK